LRKKSIYLVLRFSHGPQEKQLEKE